jgi:hypothetical protein
MKPNLADFFGTAVVRPDFAILEDDGRPEGKWVEAIFSIISKTRAH